MKRCIFTKRSPAAGQTQDPGPHTAAVGSGSRSAALPCWGWLMAHYVLHLLNHRLRRGAGQRWQSRPYLTAVPGRWRRGGGLRGPSAQVSPSPATRATDTNWHPCQQAQQRGRGPMGVEMHVLPSPECQLPSSGLEPLTPCSRPHPASQESHALALPMATNMATAHGNNSEGREGEAQRLSNVFQ